MPHDDGDRGLTIREIAAASGVREATLRMWEARHGFPAPERLASGHRRYSERDLEQVRDVQRARAEGVSLATAIAGARRLGEEPRPSVFRALRDRFPELQAHLLPRRVLVHLSHAIEDQSAQAADRPLLFACFQRESFYRREEPRWRALARIAERAVVLADFPRPRTPADGPAEIPIGPRDALAREWVVVCDGPRFAACLVAWERPRLGGERRFETLWTVDAAVVREAARACCELAGRTDPGLVDGLRERLAGTPTAGDDRLRAAVELSTRMVLYATGTEA
jgi:DICT domain-containing protein/predicted DNA-binding transcriptional regulator AlpA